MWVGHSLGGTVALRAAVRRPDAVRGRRPRGGGGDRLVDTRRPGYGHADRARPARQGDRSVPARDGRARGSGAASRSAGGAWGTRVALEPELAEAFLLGPCAPHEDAPGRPRASRDRSARRPGADRVPGALPLGRERQVGEARRRDRVRAPSRRARSATIAGCGHLLIGERPEVCLAAIEEFVASL